MQMSAKNLKGTAVDNIFVNINLRHWRKRFYDFQVK